jgi:hypothetical protein
LLPSATEHVFALGKGDSLVVAVVTPITRGMNRVELLEPPFGNPDQRQNGLYLTE